MHDDMIKRNCQWSSNDCVVMHNLCRSAR